MKPEELFAKIMSTIIGSMRTHLDANIAGNGAVMVTDNKFMITSIDQSGAETLRDCKTVTGYEATSHGTHWSIPLNRKTFDYVLLFQSVHGLTWHPGSIDLLKAKFGEDCFERVTS